MKDNFMRNKFVRIPLFILAGGAAILAFSFVTMHLWNALIPDIFHFSPITYWQALGLLVLSKLFFSGGMQGHRAKHNCRSSKSDFETKFKDFSPEDREKIKAIMKERWDHHHSGGKCCEKKTTEE